MALVALACALGIPVQGQDLPNEPAGSSLRSPEVDYVVDFWRMEQGLPHNTVSAILQTRDGYLWVGTAGGLVRFDGLKFTVVGDETELKNARITALLEDDAGVLWVGTQGGGVFTLQHGAIKRLSVADGLADNAVTSLAQDDSGTIWIGTQRGLNRWRKSQLDTFVSDGLRAGEAVVALSAGRSRVMWITTRSEVFQIRNNTVEPFRIANAPQEANAELRGAYEDKQGNLWTFSATFLLNLSQGNRYNAFRSLDPTSSRVWTICEQDDGTFWIGTSGRGLARFYKGRFDVVGVREGLDQCDVRALFADREGNLWIGTSGNGLARLRVREWRIFTGTDGLVSPKLTSLAADVGGSFWVGTEDAGLMRFDGAHFESFPLGFPFNCAMNIQSLCVDPKGALWVGTWGKGLFRFANGRQWRFDSAEGLDDDVVLSVVADPQSDAVWAGTRAGGLHRVQDGKITRYSTSERGAAEPVKSLYMTRAGRLLVGLGRGGVSAWDGQRLTPIPSPPAMATHPVRALLEDRNGRLWVGTSGAGAFCRQAGTWWHLTVAQGLASDSIGQIIQDSAGNFWFGSDSGVFQVRAGDMESFLRGNASSVICLLSARGQTGADLKCAGGFPGALMSPGGALWFASNGGLLLLDPHSIKSSAPRLKIERVTVDGMPISPAELERNEPLKLGPGIGSLDFDFAAINFITPERTRFRYKMEGSETIWAESDAYARRAHYGPLPPGRYRFRVIAASADGVWNEDGASISLVIPPPIWKAWWFIALCSFSLVGCIWLLVRYVSLRQMRAQLKESEQRRTMERERTRIAQDMHDEIGSKLTRISFLSEIARQDRKAADESSDTVEAIAGTSRELLQALDEIVWAVNPRNDNLEHLVGYLEQYAKEYFQMTPVECSVIIPPILPTVELTAEFRHNVFLAFEEALGNTLKHADPKRVRIEMNIRDDVFVILVQDDGKGFTSAKPGAKPGRNGLLNMQARMGTIGGECETDSHPGEGTKVYLKCPLPMKSSSALFKKLKS
jgi:ligand-binding sensor domain-containing protein/signal transduction histidine kinase